MENDTDDVVSRKALTQTAADFGLANLIEAVELLRRKKIEPNQSYSETFFSAAKQYLG